MRLLAPLAALLCVALLAAGCGGGSGSSSTSGPKKATAPNAPAGSKVLACDGGAAEAAGLRATAVDCGTAGRVMRRWGKHRSCSVAAGASRASCTLGSFRCQAVRADQGIAVSCARPGADIAFLAQE